MMRFFEELRSEGIRPTELAKRARHRLLEAREGGVERLWMLQADALQRVEQALEATPEQIPLISRVADAAERFVSRRLEAVTAVPIVGFDELNAKAVRHHLHDLGHMDLLRVRRYEHGHKNRKSVLDDIGRELAKRTAANDSVEAPGTPA